MKAHCILLDLLLTAGALHAGTPKSLSTFWKPADYWVMRMEQFSRAEANDPASARYTIRALVSGKSTIGGVDCWSVEFMPGEETPPHLESRYSLSVAKDAGWPLKVIYSRVLKRVPAPVLAASAIGVGHPLNRLGIVGATPSLKAGYIYPTEQLDWLEGFGKASFITAAPEGYPIEFFPLHESGQFSSAKSGTTLTLRTQKEGEYLVVEAALKVGDKDKLVIRQKWIEGEKWWREYERYVDGRKDLQARQVMPPPLKVLTPVDPAKAIAAAAAARAKKQADEAKIQALQERFAKERADREKFYQNHPLFRDPKLHVKLSIVAKHPSLKEVLDKLRAGIGLELTLADNLTNHEPAMGDWQMPNAPAFRLLEQIQNIQLKDGRWEKTEKGYRLTGISLASRPSPGGFPWLRFGLGLLGLVVVGGVIFWWERRRKRTGAGA